MLGRVDLDPQNRRAILVEEFQHIPAAFVFFLRFSQHLRSKTGSQTLDEIKHCNKKEEKNGDKIKIKTYTLKDISKPK